MIPVAKHILRVNDSPSYGMVVRPPISAAQYRTVPGDAVTLVNLSAWKGAHVFYALARRMPGTPFLGVRGWGDQVIPNTVPHNVELLEPTDDMQSVFSRTRILLAPSWSEGFPRTPIEAAASGIPVVAHTCDGLREVLGDSGIYADRDDVDAWQTALTILQDSNTYRQASINIAGRFAELEALSRSDVATLGDWIRDVTLN